jgi:CRISPR-associated protein Cmr5
MSMENRMRLTLDQKRANYAWKHIENTKVDINEFTSVSKSIPSLIMNSGLMQTFAFMKSKEKSASYKVLLDIILEWLCERQLISKSGFREAMEELFKSGSFHFMQTTNETMELLRWIRQFADARKATQSTEERR